MRRLRWDVALAAVGGGLLILSTQAQHSTGLEVAGLIGLLLVVAGLALALRRLRTRGGPPPGGGFWGGPWGGPPSGGHHGGGGGHC